MSETCVTYHELAFCGAWLAFFGPELGGTLIALFALTMAAYAALSKAGKTG